MRPPRWRVMTWVIFIWMALTLISAFRFAAANQACSSQVNVDRVVCHREAQAGFRGAVARLVAGTIVLGIGWVITEPRQHVALLPSVPEPPSSPRAEE